MTLQRRRHTCVVIESVVRKAEKNNERRDGCDDPVVAFVLGKES